MKRFVPLMIHYNGNGANHGWFLRGHPESPRSPCPKVPTGASFVRAKSLEAGRLPYRCECEPEANPLFYMLVIFVPLSLVGDPSLEATCHS